jgi:hypothetical protein
MKLAEILTGPEMWCQRSYHRHDGRMCLVGGTEALFGGTSSLPHGEYTRLLHAIRAVDSGWVEGVASWNDEAGRTWDEVAAVVDAYDRDRLLNP